MQLIVGWNKGGVGTSFVCDVLRQAGIDHVEHCAHEDNYTTDRHIRIIPLSKAEVGYFVPNSVRISEYEKMLSGCSDMQVIFLPNNVRPDDVDFIVSELRTKSGISPNMMSISPAIPGRAKYNRWDGNIQSAADDADLTAFIDYVRCYRSTFLGR